ncbi:putative pentatricopeptide repeat-containing protein [Spatholobus suberectus]|nr:putative pentatricopeptide repeat-containing protein [Spatholobus suberectus]
MILCYRRLLHNSTHALSTQLALSEQLLHHYNSSHHHLQFPPLNLEYHRYKDSSSVEDAHQLHLQIHKTGLSNDVFWCNTLINIYVRLGNLVSAQKLFDEMPQKNLVSWSCLISGYAQNGMPDEACILFKGAISAGLFPNHYAIGSALRACQELGPTKLKLGMEIHGLISKSPCASDMVLSNVLMSMYSHCSASIDDARHVFDEIKIKTSASWNSIISVYCRRGDAISAFKLFSSMQREATELTCWPNEYTFCSLVTVACSLVDCGLTLLEQMLARIEKSSLVQDLYVGSALVSGFARYGLIDSAKMIFEQMGDRNAVTMNGLMVGLARQHQGEEAAKIFKEMKYLVEINAVSYAVLLSAFTEFSNLKEGKRKGQESVIQTIKEIGYTQLQYCIAERNWKEKKNRWDIVAAFPPLSSL